MWSLWLCCQHSGLSHCTLYLVELFYEKSLPRAAALRVSPLPINIAGDKDQGDIIHLHIVSSKKLTVTREWQEENCGSHWVETDLQRLCEIIRKLHIAKSNTSDLMGNEIFFEQSISSAAAITNNEKFDMTWTFPNMMHLWSLVVKICNASQQRSLLQDNLTDYWVLVVVLTQYCNAVQIFYK